MPSHNTYRLTWVSLTLDVGYLHGCSSKVQPPLLTLDEGYLLTATLPDLQRGMAPLGPPAPWSSHRSMDVGLLLPAATPGLRCGVAPPGHRPWPRVLPLASDMGWLLPTAAPDLGRGVTPLGRA